MFDEMDLLRDNRDLANLLDHYAQVGTADSEAWQDRVMEFEGVQSENLVKLHGYLIAHGWIAQNTGVTPTGRPGAGCYRITSAGRRALKQAQSDQAIEDTEAAA